MKFEKLGVKERKLLLTALGFDFSKLVCQMCHKSANYKKCSIMPPINTELRATICCGSPLCYAEYFSGFHGEILEDEMRIEKIRKLEVAELLKYHGPTMTARIMGLEERTVLAYIMKKVK